MGGCRATNRGERVIRGLHFSKPRFDCHVLKTVGKVNVKGEEGIASGELRYNIPDRYALKFILRNR